MEIGEKALSVHDCQQIHYFKIFHRQICGNKT